MRTAAEISFAFADRDTLDGRDSFFLVGIGGAGMSALARMLKHRGHNVRGTDSTPSDVTSALELEGIPVSIGHSEEGIHKGDAVILSDAIDLAASPEVSAARHLECPLFRRSQALGWLLKGANVIAVTGTHGKTTTTGMLGAALIEAGLDPTVVVGANIPAWGGPVVEGQGTWAVVEACEAYDSFHDLDPKIVVLTNLELDHVDFHGNYERLRDSVVKFVSKADCLIYCGSDDGAREVASLAGVTATDYRQEHFDGKPALSGRHNLLDAAGALMAAVSAGADREAAKQGIERFTGAERRLQILRENSRGISVVDDYAHHPSEIAASIQALREKFQGQRLVVVYQPHLYSRTAGLIEEFANALTDADVIVLTDIYPAREEPMAGISSSRIAELIAKPTFYYPSRHFLPEALLRLAEPGDVVVGMGAGNIGEFAPSLVRLIEDRSKPGRKTRVVVIFGADSAEREISIQSGRAVHRALLNKGYESRLLDLTEVLMTGGNLKCLLGEDRPDIAFLAVHGTNAEDGTTQGLLQTLRIPYTGSNLKASAICMDKQLTKEILSHHGLPVPKGELLRTSGESVSLPLPLIVKPNAQGSTVGLSYVDGKDQLLPAIARAFVYDDAVLVEEWVKGIEISVPVLGDKALPVVEIAPTSGKYDYASKYLPGATEEIIPARLPEEVLARAQSYALQAHKILGCAGATRTDMIVRMSEPLILEVNTLPGLTGTSILPNSARAAGIGFEELVDWIVKDALRCHGEKA